MISIRTGLVVAAFAAMGLTSVAEYVADRLASRAEAAAETGATVGTQQALPGKGRLLTQKTPAAPREPDLTPWI